MNDNTIYRQIAGVYNGNDGQFSKRKVRRYWGKAIGPVVRYRGKTQITGSKTKFSEWFYENGSYVVEDFING